MSLSTGRLAGGGWMDGCRTVWTMGEGQAERAGQEVAGRKGKEGRKEGRKDSEEAGRGTAGFVHKMLEFVSGGLSLLIFYNAKRPFFWTASRVHTSQPAAFARLAACMLPNARPRILTY